MFRLFSLFFLLAIISSCTSNKRAIIQNQEGNDGYQVHNIILRQHQVKPIDYMLAHPEQKGLILAHYLGTGKTYTALAYAEKQAPNPVLILAPSFLESNWLYHMKQMGIPNRSRYEFFSFSSATQELVNKDLSNYVVIIDEVHKLINNIKTLRAEERSGYSALYQKIRTAQHVMLLSGTPVFKELSDLSYLINLASGQDLLPTNNRLFLDEFTQIKKARSFFRGHLLESHIMWFFVPFVLASIPLAFVTPSTAVVSAVYFGGISGGFALMPAIKSALPVHDYPLRTFDVEKLKNIASKYVSYYDFRSINNPNYPTQEIHHSEVPYDTNQEELFVNFADMALTKSKLARFSRESRYKISGDFDLESTAIQERLATIPGAGLEIGNFDTQDNNNKLTEAPKFEKIREIIGENPDGVVIYSSFYESGLLLFKNYLDRHGYKNNYQILHPEQSVQTQMDVIKKYNSRQIGILLVHYKFTEGISLEKTRQLHILEPLNSQARFEQIIGRVIRFRSHSSLPETERHVDIYAWQATFGGISGLVARNDNWAKRFNEFNSVAGAGMGLSQIDPNYYRKLRAPDQYIDMQRNQIKIAISALNDLFKTYSVENK